MHQTKTEAIHCTTVKIALIKQINFAMKDTMYVATKRLVYACVCENQLQIRDNFSSIQLMSIMYNNLIKTVCIFCVYLIQKKGTKTAKYMCIISLCEPFSVC